MHGRRLARAAVLIELQDNLREQVAAALREDVGTGDVTAGLVPPDQQVEGRVIAREPGVLCGTAWFNEVFAQLSPAIVLQWQYQDGDSVEAESTLVTISGPARAVLTGERTALNFLQTLCATASAARRFVDAVAGTGCRILDTRKTLPGLRLAQKYATRCGGAQNYRIGLYDMVLIKENHIVAAGSLEAAIRSARSLHNAIKVEVEVESLAEFDRALAARADIIMLDELSQADMREAVARNRRAGAPCQLEASGSVNLSTVRAIAATGVDFISVGSITKHIQALDLSMRLTFAAR